MTNGVEYVYEQMKELQVNKYELKNCNIRNIIKVVYSKNLEVAKV